MTESPLLSKDDLAAVLDGATHEPAALALKRLFGEVAPEKMRALYASEAGEPSLWQIARSLIALEGRAKLSAEAVTWAIGRNERAAELVLELRRLAAEAGGDISSQKFQFRQVVLWHSQFERLVATPFERIADVILDPFTSTDLEAWLHIANARLAEAETAGTQARLTELREKVHEEQRREAEQVKGVVFFNVSALRHAVRRKEPLSVLLDFAEFQRPRIISWIQEAIDLLQGLLVLLNDSDAFKEATKDRYPDDYAS